PSQPAPASSQVAPLSLHDALPTCPARREGEHPEGHRARGLAHYGESPAQLDPPDIRRPKHVPECRAAIGGPELGWGFSVVGEARSEEHTSELQSRGQLVCRLPLAK